MVHTGLGLVLDELRQNLAAVHGGIFPHSVLSSQNISLLASQKPLTMDEVPLIFLVQCSNVSLQKSYRDLFLKSFTISHSSILLISLILQLEGVLGKRIAEQYGNEILVAITDYLEEHPEDATDNAGPWVAPKAKRVAEGPAIGINKAASTKQGIRVTEGSTSHTTTKAPSTRQGKRVAEGPERTTTKSQSIKDYLVKADAESVPRTTTKDQPVAEGSGPSTTKTPTKRLSLRRPASSTPVPATQKEDRKQESTKTPPQRSECIDLDSDSDQEEGQPPANNNSEDVIEETTSEEEDEFSLFKRVRRK